MVKYLTFRHIITLASLSISKFSSLFFHCFVELFKRKKQQVVAIFVQQNEASFPFKYKFFNLIHLEISPVTCTIMIPHETRTTNLASKADVRDVNMAKFDLHIPFSLPQQAKNCFASRSCSCWMSSLSFPLCIK